MGANPNRKSTESEASEPGRQRAPSVPRPGPAPAAPKAEPAPQAPEERLEPEPGIVIAGKFKLEKPLSKGGMGSVWAARHLDLDVPVAVKLMLLEDVNETSGASAESGSSHSRTAARARFEREAKAAAQLRSANIVRILDYGVFQATPYMVMELLEGQDLAARLAEVQIMTPAALARILVPIARALQAAHDAQLVHRDLKPANIFLAREGDDEVPKILDFGVARSLKESAAGRSETTIDGVLIGTPSYMSPEQATGGLDVDHRSDLWSLGVIAFRALTGRKPFPGPGALESVVQICTAPIPRPSELVPELPAEIDAFIARALERDVTLRFQSAKELARAFAHFLPKTYSSRPPRADDSVVSAIQRTAAEQVARNTAGPFDETATIPRQASEIATNPAPPLARPSRRPLLIASGIALVLAVGSMVAWRATRHPVHSETNLSNGSTQPSSAQPGFGSSTAPTANEPGGMPAAVDAGEAPLASGAQPVPSGSPPAARTAGRRDPVPPSGTKPTATPTAVPPPPASTKKGRDLGY